jgi:hypothetical protein
MPEFVEKFSKILGWEPDDFTHDGAGYLMMPLALVLIFIELKALDFLLVPDDVEGSDERVAGIMPVKTETPEKRTKSTRIPSNPNDYIMAATGMKIKKKPDENKS